MKKIYSILVFALFSMAIFQNANGQVQIVASPACAPGVAPLNLREVPLPDGGVRCFVSVTAPASFNGYQISIYKGLSNDLIQIPITVGGLLSVSETNPEIAVGIVDYVCELNVPITYVGLQNGPTGSLCFTSVALSASLPIKLSSFNAIVQGNTAVTLNWATVFEANSSHFGIERSSDGKNFTTIGTIKAAGSSNAILNYSFIDNEFSGTAFYRLKLVDLDGKSEYTKTVYANGGANASTNFSVFPNPFRSDVQLKGINASDVNKNNIRVFTVTGKQVGFKVTGSNSISIDATLPSGVYFLSVNGQTTKISKL